MARIRKPLTPEQRRRASERERERRGKRRWAAQLTQPAPEATISPAEARRQEYNAKMGQLAQQLRAVSTGRIAPAELAEYTNQLAAAEADYVARHAARSVSLGHARDVMFFKVFEALCERHFSGKIVPAGYAKKRSSPATARIVTLHLSDLHIGAALPGDENPVHYDFLTASRRLAAVVNQAAEYKRQYRDQTTLYLLLNGDIFEGLLGHDIADGYPLAEQCTAALQMLSQAVAFLSACYPKVVVWCQTGNHGRNKLRHPGRATTQKWDSTEMILYQALRMTASNLPNVRWEIPKTPWCLIPVFEKYALMTHGDTEAALKDPGVAAGAIEAALNKMNANLTYGARVDLLTFGHFHRPSVFHFAAGTCVANGALVPKNGFARSITCSDSQTGQYLWESVPRYVFGDSRFLRVDQDDDRNASWDQLIRPFRWEE